MMNYRRNLWYWEKIIREEMKLLRMNRVLFPHPALWKVIWATVLGLIVYPFYLSDKGEALTLTLR